ncbi:MAG: hypothetical protein KDA61_10920, partial [Planctomycetales bacterium]|nr:hypothetical protein [Planctomycetales bacterium]
MPSHELHTRHPRSYQTNRFVYPVLSRRSGGISLGVNLNPDKICNFDCVYCQVDRRVAPQVTEVDRDVLAAELVEMLEEVLEAIELGEDGSLNPTGRLETLPVDALVLAL